MKKKTFRFSALLLASSATFSACGGANSEGQDASAGVTDTIAETTSSTSSSTTSSTVALPTVYQGLSAREWKLLEKNPDGYVGKGIKVAGRIFQFDSNTGTSAFLAKGYPSRVARNGDRYGFEGSMMLVQGTEQQLAKYLQDDKFICDCIVVGSYSYSTKAGGSNNAIWVFINSISQK